MKVTEKYLEELDPNKSHILVCKTPIVLPFSFITHAFILTKQRGIINRYEVLGVPASHIENHGCVFKNELKPWQGMLYLFTGDIRKSGHRFSSTLVKHFSSDTLKDIDNIIKKIEDDYLLYPHRYKYNYLGANSNTFTSWLISYVCLDVALPWNAYGKGFKVK